MVNTISVDAVVMQVARASVAMALTKDAEYLEEI